MYWKIKIYQALVLYDKIIPFSMNVLQSDQFHSLIHSKAMFFSHKKIDWSYLEEGDTVN